MNIGELLDRVRAAKEKPGAYAFLSEIYETLEAMQESRNDSHEQREHLARGLERFVLENFEFSESQLGGELLELAEAFVTSGE
jgi:hypothetical protein